LLFEQSLFPAVLADQTDALQQAVVDEVAGEAAVLKGIRQDKLDHITR
jgi:hypothetical protein